MRRFNEHKFSTIPTYSKKLITYMIDFLLVMVITLVTYSIVDFSFFQAKGSYANKINESISLVQKDLSNIFEESHLGYLDEKTNEIIEDKEMTKEYVYNLTLTSLKYHKISSRNETIYNDVIKNKKPIDVNVDNVSYYYVNFKNENINDYKEESKNALGLNYYVNSLFKEINNDLNSYYFINEDGYPLLRKGYADALDKHIVDKIGYDKVDDKDIDLASLYAYIFKSYNDLLNEARNDLSNNYLKYSLKANEFFSLRNSLIGTKILEITLSFLFATLIAYLCIPLLTNNNQTLGQKLIKTTQMSADGLVFSPIQYIARFLLESILLYPICSIILVMLYNYNSVYFFFYEIFPNFNYLIVLIITFSLMIASLIVMACNKSRKNLVDYIEYSITRDIEF